MTTTIKNMLKRFKYYQKKNNFHLDDIEFLVCANPSFIYDKLQSHSEFQNKKMIEECIVKKNDEFITNFYKNNENNKGIFICIEKNQSVSYYITYGILLM